MFAFLEALYIFLKVTENTAGDFENNWHNHLIKKEEFHIFFYLFFTGFIWM